MDDVIQNIKIEDIVPRNHRQTNNSFKELEDLAISIRENGIKEPLIVKKKDDRYEIISGNKRYMAAILAGGISKLPVIIKDYSDDNLIKNIEKNGDILFNSINNNSDIVNLSELNKEYEREDFNMNNELTNNNVSQPVTNGSTPTFGGRFFPSLEDQPTNMTFSAQIEQPPVQPTLASNLIDLTDTSNTPANSVVQPTMSAGIMNPTIEQPVPGNILNLESLTQNNDVVQPVPVQPEVVVPVEQPQPVTEVVQPAVAIEPQPVVMEPSVVESTLDLGIQQNVVPTVEVPVPSIQPEVVVPVEQPQSIAEVVQPAVAIEHQPIVMGPSVVESTLDLGIQQNVVPTVEVPVPPIQPEVVVPVEQQPVAEVIQPTVAIEPQPVVMESHVVEPTLDLGIQQNVVPTVEVPVAQVQQKDVLPVINTLKAVSVSLESFGYTVRITDEDLPTSYKITIEVEK